MGRFQLLSVFQYAIFTALIVIGATTYYALQRVPESRAGNLEETIAVADLPEGYTAGRRVWNDNGCGTCHAKSMKVDATGPALAGVTDRWAAEPKENLYAWIRNSAALAESGKSPRASRMIDWKPAVMSSYPRLSDEKIEALLLFIEAGV